MKTFLKEQGLLEDDGNIPKLAHLERLTIDTTQDDIDSEYLETFYNSVSYIDALVLASDKAPETLPPAEKMDKIIELHIGSQCTSFENDNIREELKYLVNLERIFVEAAVERMRHSSLCQLANLNGEKPIMFFAYEPAIAKNIVGAMADDQSDIGKTVKLAYGGDRLFIDRMKRTITVIFGLSSKTLQKDLFYSAAGFKFCFQMVSLSGENKDGYLYKSYLQFTKPRVTQLKADICSENAPVTTTNEFDEVTMFELVSLMDDCTSAK